MKVADLDLRIADKVLVQNSNVFTLVLNMVWY